MKTLEQLKREIREDNTLVVLEEVGYIDIDDINEDLNLFIQALEEVTGKEYYITDFKTYKVITEYKEQDNFNMNVSELICEFFKNDLIAYMEKNNRE